MEYQSLMITIKVMSLLIIHFHTLLEPPTLPQHIRHIIVHKVYCKLILIPFNHSVFVTIESLKEGPSHFTNTLSCIPQSSPLYRH